MANEHTRTSRIVEVCVDNYQSAIKAIAGGAQRLELCSSLDVGGLTPTPGLLQQVILHSPTVKVFCMLRCRPGNFHYTAEEMEIMKKDSQILEKYGAHGFVFGALTDKMEIDMKQCRDILASCYPLPVTFHRAFDLIKRPFIELEVAIDLGFQRILTSGQEENAQLGVKFIKKLMEQAKNRIIIVPGGGINKKNCSYIMDYVNPMEIHGSFKKAKALINETDANGTSPKQLHLNCGDGSINVVDEQLVAEIVHIFNNT